MRVNSASVTFLFVFMLAVGCDGDGGDGGTGQSCTQGELTCDADQVVRCNASGSG